MTNKDILDHLEKSSMEMINRARTLKENEANENTRIRSLMKEFCELMEIVLKGE